MRRLTLLCLVLCAAAPTAASAQIVNVLTRFPGERKPGLHGSVQLAVDWRTGNTEYLDLQGALSGEWLIGRHLILGLAQGERRSPAAGSPSTTPWSTCATATT